MGVVKADAYGHGVMEVARTLLENGVSRLQFLYDEAIQFAKTVSGSILILSYTTLGRRRNYLNNVAKTVSATIWQRLCRGRL